MLKDLTPSSIRKVRDMSLARDQIDRPEFVTMADAQSGALDAVSAATTEITQFIQTLSPDARAELIALAWLGRGDSGDDFTQLVQHAHRTSDAGDSRYLAAKGPLHEYLDEGARRLGVTF